MSSRQLTVESWTDFASRKLMVRVTLDGEVYVRAFDGHDDADYRDLRLASRHWERSVALDGLDMDEEAKEKATLTEQTLAIECLFPALTDDPRLPA